MGDSKPTEEFWILLLNIKSPIEALAKSYFWLCTYSTYRLKPCYLRKKLIKSGSLRSYSTVTLISDLAVDTFKYNRIKMLGTFQQSHLRIEVEASQALIRDSLLQSERLRRWLWPQRFSAGLPEQLHPGLTFGTWVGPLAIQHQVEVVNSNCLRLLLSQGIDGYHEWYWGEGWVQSRLEGVSLLPLNLGQTLSLLRLRQFLASAQQ